AGVFAEFGAVVISQDVEFADRFDSEELAAGSAGSHVVFGGAGEFDAVKEKEILLRTIPVDGEIIGGSGVGNAGAARFLRSEIDDAGIESKQEVVASAVERKILDGLVVHETQGVCDDIMADDGDVGVHGNRVRAVQYKFGVYGSFLIDREEYAVLIVVLEIR